MNKALCYPAISVLYFILNIIIAIFLTFGVNQNILADTLPSLDALKRSEYMLKSGDELTITVLDEKELSGKYTINIDGEIVMPLIGKVRAKDLTLKELEYKITDALQPDYLINARVSIEVLNFPPYYIMGEVSKPQSYPYKSGMTYLNAVAIAGGFTYRAVKDYVYVIRGDDPKKEEQKLSVDQQVMPGDVIRVDERYF